MNAQDALLEVDRQNGHLILLAECWSEEPNKAEWPNYQAKIRKMFPRVIVEKVTRRPFGFIIRAEDQRLQIKYMVHNPEVARTAVFSPIGHAAQKKARASK